MSSSAYALELLVQVAVPEGTGEQSMSRRVHNHKDGFDASTIWSETTAACLCHCHLQLRKSSLSELAIAMCMMNLHRF